MGRDRPAGLRHPSAVDDAPTGPDDAGLTPRLVRRVRSDFPDTADDVLELLTRVDSGNQHRERVVASVVLSASSDADALVEAVELSRTDWRDVLVNGGLADEGWQDRLDQILGPPSG